MYLDIPRRLEQYSVAARPLTQEELEQVAYIVEKDVRIWHEDPRGWTLDGFIGFHVCRAMLEWQLTIEQGQWLRDRLHTLA